MKPYTEFECSEDYVRYLEEEFSILEQKCKEQEEKLKILETKYEKLIALCTLLNSCRIYRRNNGSISNLS